MPKNGNRRKKQQRRSESSNASSTAVIENNNPVQRIDIFTPRSNDSGNGSSPTPNKPDESEQPVQKEVQPANTNPASSTTNATHARNKEDLNREAESLSANVEAMKNVYEKIDQLIETINDSTNKCVRQEQEWQKIVAKQEASLYEKKKDLAKRENELKFKKEDLEDERETLQDLINYTVEKRVGSTEKENLYLSDDLKKSNADRDKLHAELQKLKQNDPEECGRLRTYIDGQETKIHDLHDQLSNRLSAEDSVELNDLRREKTSREIESNDLRNKNKELQNIVDKNAIHVSKNEHLLTLNRVLEADHKILGEKLKRLEEDIKSKIDERNNESVYQDLIDIDDSLQEMPVSFHRGNRKNGIELKEFTKELQHRVGASGNPDDLYYTLEDIRSFVAGLCMSHLHLLQGISGIGKSSLPRAFCDSVGGLCETIEVQAGWRDKMDLFGHYNAFEKKFHATKFTETIYKAGSEKFKDKIVLIVLDEMNLSHPEQYAADVLSVIEKPSGEQFFELRGGKSASKMPERLSNGRLELPKNVWFIGTANHDETTKDFADKTYDRSFVLELPSNPERFKIDRSLPKVQPISCEALEQSFRNAKDIHETDADEALKWLNENLSQVLKERFGIGWGGRLASQLKRYIPVVVAAGGSWGEGIDKLVATRLLRKICNRYDNNREDLEELQMTIETTFEDKDYGEPKYMLDVIQKSLEKI
jgi:hypothetical protein